MKMACIEAGHNFSFTEIKNWLNKQALHQIHKPHPNFIQYASFNNIQILNQVHQYDTIPMPHDKVGNRVYKYRGVIKDVTTRYHRRIEKHAFVRQDAKGLLLPLFERSRSGCRESIKWGKIIAKPAVKYERPIGLQLAYYDLVRYLLKPGEQNMVRLKEELLI
ncbi:hypothetical protein GLOIN_2v1878227 [Rhizophagus clarus]|uniref:Uncharacterized protein n=1 Tax=Rhizophagus clarus TaxID=94130 RepID=A0A8H3M2J2_9GLOM|nr:hypothetical protein GLOIN_2v1878227 [Rhizophagus clarus]